jgi:hypothetical protein
VVAPSGGELPDGILSFLGCIDRGNKGIPAGEVTACDLDPSHKARRGQFARFFSCVSTNFVLWQYKSGL